MNLEGFDPDMMMVLVEWLEIKEKARYTLSGLIDELTGRNDNLSDEDQSLSDVS